MATRTNTAYPDSSNLTNWKAWAKPISDALGAFGWTQTADSGQVDWSTVTLPATGIANSVYEMWKSADSLSVGFPIYLKMEYYVGTSNQPGVRFQVGTGGTNGSGTLNTPKGDSRDMVFYSGVTQTSRLLNCYFSGDSGSFRMLLFNGSNTGTDYYAPTMLVIGRSRDASGNATGEYVATWSFFNTGRTPFSQVVFNAATGGATTFSVDGWLCCIAYPGTGTSNGYGGNVLVSPVFPFIGALGNPTPDLVVGSRTDFPTDGGAVTCTLYGTSHNYLTIFNATAPMNPVYSQTQANPLMRYE